MNGSMKPWETYKFKYLDDAPLYAQWVNQPESVVLGNGQHPDRGGWFCEAQNFPGIPATVTFSNGKTSSGRFTSALQVAIVAWRFRWEDQNKVVWPDYAPGRHGKIQVVAAVQGPSGVIVPIGLTARGMASKDLLYAIRRHRQLVAAHTGGKAPGYAFWMFLDASRPTRASKKQNLMGMYTPIILNELVRDDTFVGADVIQALESIQWLEKWRKGSSTPEPNGVPTEEVREDGEEVFNPADRLGWALGYPAPVGGKSFKAGTPMGELSEQVLMYFRDNLATQYPEAAAAAAIILDHMQENEGYEDIPF